MPGHEYVGMPCLLQPIIQSVGFDFRIVMGGLGPPKIVTQEDQGLLARGLSTCATSSMPSGAAAASCATEVCAVSMNRVRP